VEFPVEVQISGTSDVDPNRESVDNEQLRVLAGRVQDILRPITGVQVVQNDWFQESPEVKLKIDPDRANLAGITNRDVAESTTAAMSGTTVTTLREGNQQIPVIARLRSQERARLSDVVNLYVYSSQGSEKVPLRTVSSVANEMVTERHSPPGALPHDWRPCFSAARSSSVRDFAPGDAATRGLSKNHAGWLSYADWRRAGEAGGGFRESDQGIDYLDHRDLCGVVAAIRQRGETLPGSCGCALRRRGGADLPRVMGAPFGFMAFLGIASLIGVIVARISHTE